MTAGRHVGGMDLLGGVGVDIGGRTCAEEKKAETVEVVLAGRRVVPPGDQAQVDPVHVMLGGEHRE